MSLRKSPGIRLLLILLFLLPLIAVFTLSARPLLERVLFFWFMLLFWACLIWIILGRPHNEGHPATDPQELQHIDPAAQPPALRNVMDIHLAMEQDGVQIYRGPLRVPADEALTQLQSQFPGQTPLLMPDDQHGASIILVPQSHRAAVASAAHSRNHAWINWLLLIVTFVTTTWAGASHQGIDLRRHPDQFRAGLPYALGLMAILGIHELGHYITARIHRMNVTPPYFIPVPFGLGTFGAFIQLKSPSQSRRSLFDVAVAGPLAGLAVAIPALLYGLHTSQLIPLPATQGDDILHGTSIGSSILLALLTKLSFGSHLVPQGQVLHLSPLAFAGWLGLLVTALNLLPIGQLDGGHTARAMFGSRAGATISTIAMWTLFLMAVFVWQGLFTFAIIVYFIAGRGHPPLNDITPISPGRQVIGWITFAILVLIITPLPASVWSVAGIPCPYL